jgi:hypothetical protein
MACKRPGVRVPLAPLHFKSTISNTEPVVLITVEGQNEGQVLAWLTCGVSQRWRYLLCCGGFGSVQEVMNLRVHAAYVIRLDLPDVEGCYQ